MASGTITMGILGDATYEKKALTDQGSPKVFNGTVYLTRIGPFVQISGVDISLVNDLGPNTRVYAGNILPSNWRPNRDFPVNTLVNQRQINGGVYINAAGTLFFMSGSVGFTTSDKFNFSGVFITAAYGAS